MSLLLNFVNRIKRRPPDFVIGGKDNPYLLRWWLLPRNKIFNVYIHLFLRSDDDRALHDHPWANISRIVDGECTEHTIAAGGIHYREILRAGDWKFRLSGKISHRIELHKGLCTTIFITGPRYRNWGFHCPDEGFIPWEKFTASDDPGRVGKGCDQ